MVHEMKLQASPFDKISSGEKTIELRLYDKKRRKINIGDYIIFTNLSNEFNRIAVKVTALYRYAVFEDLFFEFPLERCGFSSEISVQDAAKQMTQYYSEESVKAYGVIGIKIELIALEDALKRKADDVGAEFDRLFPDGMK